MDIRKNPEYIQLEKDNLKASQEYHIASQKLKKYYFLEIDKKVAEIEEKTKLAFSNLLNQNFRNTLLNFRFCYDPAHFLFLGEIKYMMISGFYYDLGFTASRFPKNQKVHNHLISVDQDYKETCLGMENKLKEMGLHPSARPVKINGIEKFFSENRIQGIVPKLF